ncbi:MAG: hypothetical protein IJS68_03365 [Clostridia bacterium]|nr:hypothetical protein [Clostridia bacterium]
MNYGKIAYQKVSDLEKRFATFSTFQTSSDNNLFEITKTGMSEALGGGYELEFGNIYSTQGKNISFFLHLEITATSAQNLDAHLSLGGVEICSQGDVLSVGNNQVCLQGVGLISNGDSADLKLSIDSTSGATLNFVSLIVIGATTKETTSTTVELRACSVDNNLAVSYIKNGKIYIATTAIDNPKTWASSFTEFLRATTHAICYNVFDNSKPLICAYVDEDKDLYYAVVGSNTQSLVAQNVDSVCILSSTDSGEKCLVIVYVKNGGVFFKTLENYVLSAETSIALPNATFKKVRAFASDDASRYIVATDDEDNNYIVYTIIPAFSKKLFDTLVCDVSITATVYE